MTRGCYFHRQPETDEEVQCAVNAIWVSCMQAPRYAGMDESIRVRLKVLGEGQNCDHPIDPADEPRTRVRFSLQADDVVALVKEFAPKPHEGVSVHVEGDARQAALDLGPQSLWRYRVERLEDRHGAPTWLLVKERDFLPCRDVLVRLGAVDIAWFSKGGWESGGPGYRRSSSCSCPKCSEEAQ